MFENLALRIRNSNRNREKKVCMFTEGDKHTYGELGENIDRFKSFLLSETNKEDKIGLMDDNTFDSISAYFACLETGRVAVPLNPSIEERNLEYINQRCNIPVFLVSEQFREVDGSYNFRSFKSIQNRGYIDETPDVEEDDVAALMHTSGSTGKPNAVVVSHRNLVANTTSIVEYLGMEESERTMIVLPFYYCFGASLLHTTFMVGGSVVLHNSFQAPQKAVERMKETKCTIFAGVPTTYKLLIENSKLEQTELPTLRYALQAGGNLENHYLKKLDKLLKPTDVVVMYGQTEATARLSYLPPDKFYEKMGSIGKGIPGVELRIVNEEGEEVEEGEIGEIIAKGDNITKGYFKNDSETEETFKGGWLYTGDMAKKDEDGFIYIVGRKKNFAKIGGKRVSLDEIESALTSLENILDAAVVSVPDEIRGETAFAFVKLENDMTEEQIIEECSQSLRHYKVPKYVEIVDDLPKNSYGKIRQSELEKRAKNAI